jgi:hypothetical protein
MSRSSSDHNRALDQETTANDTHRWRLRLKPSIIIAIAFVWSNGNNVTINSFRTPEMLITTISRDEAGSSMMWRTVDPKVVHSTARAGFINDEV